MGHTYIGVPNLSYDGVSAAIGVQHTEVANLGVVSDAFWRLLL